MTDLVSLVTTNSFWDHIPVWPSVPPHMHAELTHSAVAVVTGLCGLVTIAALMGPQCCPLLPPPQNKQTPGLTACSSATQVQGLLQAPDMCHKKEASTAETDLISKTTTLLIEVYATELTHYPNHSMQVPACTRPWPLKPPAVVY